MALLCQQQPDCDGLSALVDNFDATYVSGTARTIQRPADAASDQPSVPSLRLRRIPPIFPADKWNVHDTTVSGGDFSRYGAKRKQICLYSLWSAL